MDNNTNTCNLLDASAIGGPTKSPSSIVQNVASYFQIPTVNNNSSCKKDVVSIDSVRWHNYNHSGSEMTPDMLCGVAKITSSSDSTIDGLNQQLSGMFQGMTDTITKTDQYMESFQSNTFSTNDANLQTTVNSILMNKVTDSDKINSEYLNVSNITVLQRNTMYTVWCLIALICFMVTAGVISYIMKNVGDGGGGGGVE